MIAIKTNKENWNEEALLGQLDNGDVVLEVETTPTFDHEDITQSSIKFHQRCLPGSFGEELTYTQIAAVKAVIDVVGQASTPTELLIKAMDEKELAITNLELALVAVYEEVTSV